MMSNYNYFAIFRIMLAFERECSPRVILKAIRNMTLSQTPYFANLLHDKFQERYNQNPLLARSLIETRKRLIIANLKHGNSNRAAEMWKLNQNSNPEFAQKNVILFQSLIEKLNDEESADLLFNYFPKTLYTDPDIVDFLIAYFGQSPKYRTNFEYITKSLKPPLKRNTLSLLFASFISQDREEAAEKILQVIFKTKNGINSEDFQVIIKKLLAKHQIRQCVDMCLRNDFRVSETHAD
ncbi:hypothetical protein METBIDRAFT_148405 [Metschnikowia bicuspidata var. bicuspidata NRRL YB-4993]|uniref:ELYS-like domain-containing protein n=1 Tax=Metschnikowia bicuspidata var. bicuspidata NRRL YB-4993 TaxID=869754 RepID=A0A1A0HE60_9ASCO|nr:hypothetical protein METBIDRAFT_148405 [Metschnikowia bicuspidata var. bicuspidata NRRL YB-4993]OBA22187.1 hypothetical protein METBIDRAFT_148405 [Metschnikowia bicuspidata var. bicuspidata NRRL YB-4993]